MSTATVNNLYIAVIWMCYPLHMRLFNDNEVIVRASRMNPAVVSNNVVKDASQLALARALFVFSD